MGSTPARFHVCNNVKWSGVSCISFHFCCASSRVFGSHSARRCSAISELLYSLWTVSSRTHDHWVFSCLTLCTSHSRCRPRALSWSFLLYVPFFRPRDLHLHLLSSPSFARNFVRAAVAVVISILLLVRAIPTHNSAYVVNSYLHPLRRPQKGAHTPWRRHNWMESRFNPPHLELLIKIRTSADALTARQKARRRNSPQTFPIR
jgi:hypothetical protein